MSDALSPIMAQASPEQTPVATAAAALQTQAAAAPEANSSPVELKEAKARRETAVRKSMAESVLTEASTTTATAGARPTMEPGASVGVSETHRIAPLRKAVEDAVHMMRRMDSGSVALVVQPDQETRLAVHIKLQNGRYEAVAILEQGNYSQLGAEWEQLQRRLSDQGVRLAPLVSNLNHTPSFAGSFSSARDHREAESHEDAPQPALASPRRLRVDGKSANRTRAREWWA
jgi:hypothetical protein